MEPPETQGNKGEGQFLLHWGGQVALVSMCWADILLLLTSATAPPLLHSRVLSDFYSQPHLLNQLFMIGSGPKIAPDRGMEY